MGARASPSQSLAPRSPTPNPSRLPSQQSRSLALHGWSKWSRSRSRARPSAGAATPARSSSPTPSSSSEEETQNFEFIIVINGDPLGIQRLPDKFGDFVAGKEPATLQPREAGCGFCRWPVDVLFDGRGKMYLHTGCEEFARVHNLEAGCVLTFLYEGDVEMSVKVFDDTSCRRHYHSEDKEDGD